MSALQKGLLASKLGLYAGLYFVLAQLVLQYFHFVTHPLLRGHDFLSMIMILVYSILLANGYMLVLGKFRSPWAGLAYGIVLAACFIGAIFFTHRSWLTWNTAITELCLITVWGLFVGYTYAFEAHEVIGHEPRQTASANTSQ